jgi:hypothetical protein
VVRAGSQRSREAGNSRAIASVEAVKGAVPPIHTEMGALQRKGAAALRPYEFTLFAIRYSPSFTIRHSPYSAVHGLPAVVIGRLDLRWGDVASGLCYASAPCSESAQRGNAGCRMFLMRLYWHVRTGDRRETRLRHPLVKRTP